MMNRLLCVALTGVVLLCSELTKAQNPDQLLLRDYRPRSIYHIPVTRVARAKFPVVDMHVHSDARNENELKSWMRTMDEKGVEKSIILTFATGRRFDSLYAAYARYPDRFEVWCGIDYTGSGDAGWPQRAVRELERCFKVGARGVGELGDKGLGELYSWPTPGYGIHIDDPRLKPLIKRCGELNMPISIHVAEPMWMYEPMDSTNDGLMNAYKWKVDQTQPGLLGHGALVKTLENAVSQNPQTIFVACHLANCEYDLEIIGRLLEKYPNLYADIAARFAEVAPIPRYMRSFFEKYQDKLVYGTDMGMAPSMYETTFRILESFDEHFYLIDLSGYHWSCNGFGLPDDILRKVYGGNAKRIIKGH